MLTALSGAATVTDWELLPENPVVGDTIEIRGTASPEEKINVQVSFEKEVQVSNGRYEYLLEDVIIPNGFNNQFTVQAKGAEDLNVRVKMVLWVTKSAQASGGIATVSQSGVPPGTYTIKIDGKASDPSVKIKINALQQVEADPEGEFLYTYSTKSVPAGNFEIEVGGFKEQVTLIPKEDSVSGSTPDPALIPEPTTEENSFPSTEEDPEQTGEKEKIDEENACDDEARKDTLQDENSSKIIGFGGEQSKTYRTYVLNGFAAGILKGLAVGMIVILLYSRFKRPKK